MAERCGYLLLTLKCLTLLGLIEARMTITATSASGSTVFVTLDRLVSLVVKIDLQAHNRLQDDVL